MKTEYWEMHSMTFLSLFRVGAIKFEGKYERRNARFDGRPITIDDRFPRNEILEKLASMLMMKDIHL